MRKKTFTLLALAAILIAGAFAAWYYWTHRYDKLIVTVAQKHGLDPLLIKAVVYEESFFSPRAQSSQKAVGLMQITPIVAQELIEVTRSSTLAQAIADVSGNAMQGDPSFEEALSDPSTSLHVGCWYLQTLLNRYRDEPDSLARGPCRL